MRRCIAEEVLVRTAKRAVNAKVLPRPSWLSTVIAPPIICTSRDEIVSPSPVPPCRRRDEASAWANGSKMCWSLSAGMPHPVSLTSKCRTQKSDGGRQEEPASSAFCGFSFCVLHSDFCICTRTRTTTSPLSVNLMALPTRLMSTWRRRSGSPTRASGTWAGMW